ncbi:MAG: DUF2470 domain-containing protein [Pseudomonadota bacterium]
MPSKDVLQPVDDQVRREAKEFLRLARYGALATLDPRSGTPMASRISLATTSIGEPLFLISQLSGHFGALEADHRASILIGEPGRGDPLAHPRITVFGTAHRIVNQDREHLRARFLARQPKATLYVDFGDFAFWTLQIEGASFNGGFGKAYEMARTDLLTSAAPDLEEIETGAIAHMNEDHSDAIALYATTLLHRGKADWKLTGLDLEGLDLMAGEETARLWFDPPLQGASEVRTRLAALAKHARSLAE